MLRLAHLYPQELNLYGDKGNILALTKRLEWRGIDYQLDEINIGDSTKLSDYHLFFIGGGQDSGQAKVAQDFLRRNEEVTDFINSGGVGLAICGGYQLLGKSYETSEGDVMEGLGILDIETTAPKSSDKFQDRLIGNVVAELLINLEPRTLVGFENHSGRTRFCSRSLVGHKHNVISRFEQAQSDTLIPLAKVVDGYGNNGEDFYEGAIYRNLFGSYLHGSLLPKNPHLADELLRRAIKFAGLDIELTRLDDKLEYRAHGALT